jgi:hypothetical protein
MTFQNYCFECGKTVTVTTLLGGDELHKALGSDADIEVMHTAETGDHCWKLNRYERENLRKTQAEGLI